MLGTILKLLGFGNGASVTNMVAGAVNYGTLASLATFAWLHRDEQLTFTMSLGSLCLVGGVVFALLEFSRRTEYRGGSVADRGNG